MEPYWFNEAELDEIKGPQGQKSIAAQMFETGPVESRTTRIVVLYKDGTIETGHPRNTRLTMEAIGRIELLQQKARRLGILPKEYQRVTGPRCLCCELPRRLCLCFLLGREQTPPGTRQVYSY